MADQSVDTNKVQIGEPKGFTVVAFREGLKEQK